jgi:hypothetical protein
MRWQPGDEESERPDHVDSHDGAEQIAEKSIEIIFTALARPRCRYQQDDKDGDEEPVRSYGQGFRQRKAQSAYGKQSQDGRPAWLQMFRSIWHSTQWCDADAGSSVAGAAKTPFNCMK